MAKRTVKLVKVLYSLAYEDKLMFSNSTTTLVMLTEPNLNKFFRTKP